MTPFHWKLVEFFIYGAIGGLIGAMTKSRSLELPRIVVKRQKDGEVRKFIDMGFLAAPFLGGALAAYFDGRPETAIVYGVTSGYAGPSLLNALGDTLLKRVGYLLGPDALPHPQDGVKR
ncbi:MAG: hypothetical protein ACK47B_21740 [Armatimonadota bacterium]